MRHGIGYEQGEILLVPFPFSDLSLIKKRPVLVLSKYIGDDIIIYGITSNLKDEKFSVLISNDDLQNGFLPLKSRIKVDKIFTLEKSLILKKIGKVNIQVFSEVKKILFKII